MFVNKLVTYLNVGIFSKSNGCFKEKSSTYHFHMEVKILADFEICISVPLRLKQQEKFKTYSQKYIHKSFCL